MRLRFRLDVDRVWGMVSPAKWLYLNHLCHRRKTYARRVIELATGECPEVPEDWHVNCAIAHLKTGRRFVRTQPML